jgi:hypothetical protein
MRKLESVVAQLRKRAGQLVAKHAKAKTDLEAATAARQTFLLEGDLDDAKVAAALQAAVNSAQSTLAGYDAAIAALTMQVTEAEAALNKERNAAANKASSEALAGKVDLIEAKLTPWLAGARELYKLLEELGVLRFEVGRVGDFVLDASNQVEVAMSVALPDLRAAVVAVAEGREKLPKIAPALTVVPPAPPPTEQVFALQPARWTDHNGIARTVPRYLMAELPPQAAANALRTDTACRLDDPRVAELRKKFGRHWPPNQQPPERHHCWNWDDGSPPSNELEVIQPQYPRTAPPFDRFAVERPKMAATRTLPPGFEQHPDFVNAKPRAMVVDPQLAVANPALQGDEQ